MPILNPIPDGKKTCPRITLKSRNVPQWDLKYKEAKHWFTFLCSGNKCCLCFNYIKHAGSVFLFKFQGLGNDTSYLTHILHFFEWCLLFCFVFLPVVLSYSDWHQRWVLTTRTKTAGMHTLINSPRPRCTLSPSYFLCSHLKPEPSGNWSLVSPWALLGGGTHSKESYHHCDSSQPTSKLAT